MTDAHPKSWVESANDGQTDFPLQNLPYGVFEHGESDRIGVAIGNQILDLCASAEAGLLDALKPETVQACSQNTLNDLMALGPNYSSALRVELTALLEAGNDLESRLAPLLIPMKDAIMRLPVAVGDYSDFYAALAHATNVGRLFRPDHPLPPNYKYVPIGYHGRASSIVISGTNIHRPAGQTIEDGSGVPRFGPCQKLDYELELGIFAGQGNALGQPIPIADAESHIFGACLLNDWSARDIQMWEYQPLGPFLAKSFASTISPWVVPWEALQPFRAPAFTRDVGDPAPLPYLYADANQQRGAVDITMEVSISTRQMRSSGASPLLVSRGNFRDLYWTVAQLLTHHTSNGCNLRPGDLLGSGTISGPAGSGREPSMGCLLELTEGGRRALRLPDGEARTFLEDGDEIVLRGYCQRPDFVRIGFGECRGTVVS